MNFKFIELADILTGGNLNRLTPETPRLQRRDRD